jgi:hypothetical protein
VHSSNQASSCSIKLVGAFHSVSPCLFDFLCQGPSTLGCCCKEQLLKEELEKQKKQNNERCPEIDHFHSCLIKQDKQTIISRIR